MPRFEMDIDLDDFLWELSSSEKDELVDLLIEDGYAYKIVKNFDDRQSLAEWEFAKVITKIADNRLRLTAEEDALLKKIADRF
jgi:hypothetical protein